MIELIDQSDPNKLKFHCLNCDRTFTQSSWAALDLHNPNAGEVAAKHGIPPCIPISVKVEPKVEEPKAPKAKVAK